MSKIMSDDVRDGYYYEKTYGHWVDMRHVSFNLENCKDSIDAVVEIYNRLMNKIENDIKPMEYDDVIDFETAQIKDIKNVILEIESIANDMKDLCSEFQKDLHELIQTE